MLALLVWLAFINIWTFVFVVGLLISVFLHEVGHFSTARWTGMKATQFFMGFGPRVWSRTRGEVEYGVRALPLGAFVRILMKYSPKKRSAHIVPSHTLVVCW
jgi:membrane-associated protease RseP (regulator of RpoE activity)